MPNDFDVQIEWLNGSQIEIQASDASSLTGTEKVLIIAAGAAKETTTQAIANLGGGGGGTIPPTAYASNADAVAALGVGKLYKSTTLVNDSPIILYTV